MNIEKYNGWSNRETWLINLWLGEYLQQAIEDNELTDLYETANFISSEVEYFIHGYTDPQASLVEDLLMGAIALINFRELAEHYLEEIALSNSYVS